MNSASLPTKAKGLQSGVSCQGTLPEAAKVLGERGDPNPSPPEQERERCW